LLFCQAADISPLEPVETAKFEKEINFFEENVENLDSDENFEFEPEKKSKKSQKLSKSRKRRAWSRDSTERSAALDEIRAACPQCNPPTQQDTDVACVDVPVADLSHWDQDKFEQVLSLHLKEKHKIEDEFNLEKKYIEKLKNENGGAPKKIHITDMGDRYPCNHYPSHGLSIIANNRA